jgi:hypothetical protein
MTRANNALLTLATDGSGGISAKAFLADSGLVHLIIDVAGYMTGDPVTQCECLTNGKPLMLIFDVSPSNGNIGTQITVSGQNFAPNVQVLFGDATTGSSASIVSTSWTSIRVIVPAPPSGFTFSTEPCDGNGDGIPGGTRLLPTPISVNVQNLDGIGCVATLNNAFTLVPASNCIGDNSRPTQLSDGVVNDSDSFSHHSSVSPAGPSSGFGTAAGFMADAPVPQCQCPANGNPLPLISGVAPSGGTFGAPVTISGQNFAPHVQVMFGDATTGSSAPLMSISSTSISARVPAPPPGFIFSTEPCDENADGIVGTRYIPTPISVNVWNLDGAGCVATLSNEFKLSPPTTVCTE